MTERIIEASGIQLCTEPFGEPTDRRFFLSCVSRAAGHETHLVSVDAEMAVVRRCEVGRKQERTLVERARDQRLAGRDRSRQVVTTG